ncbi:DegV family protein, partial [candidate division WOR-3 bacterium]|nr:DegV family protein [candidate division WOR-3 bacterium]
MVVRVVTDSTCDLDPEFAVERGIIIVPCSVHFGSEPYRDRLDITPMQFFQRLREAEELPRTSQPSVGAFLTVYQELTAGEDDVVSIHISEKMSGTFSSATRAKALLSLHDRVQVVDSRFNSVALALIVLAAAEKAQTGAALESVVQHVRDVISRTHLLATADTLEYAARGGRIGKAQAFLGNLLQVKPIVQIKDGELHPIERVRTRARA